MTISEAIGLALQHHQSGRLREAESIYRQVLAVDPQGPDALHLLGAIALAQGQHQRAADFIGQAIAVNRGIADYHNNFGLALTALRRFEEAIAAFRVALELKPDSAEVHNNLGRALKAAGELEQAIDAHRAALRLAPDFAEAHNNLGVALEKDGQSEAAITAYRTALRLKPDFAEAHNNLGAVLTEHGQVEAAIAACRIALQLRPDFAEAHNNLGIALKEHGQTEAALAAYRTALRLKPDFAEAHNNLGAALKDHGQVEAAIAACRIALQLRPGFAEAHNNLGMALEEHGQTALAIAAYRSAVRLKPDFARAHNNLGAALLNQWQLDAAIASFREALRCQPDFAEACNNLGNALKDQGRIDQALAAYRRAIELKPGTATFFSNLIFGMLFHPEVGDEQLSVEQAEWNRRFVEPRRGARVAYQNEKAVGRRLRVGYVSADFREHVAGRNVLPLLRGHDHENFEVFCYADVRREDALTAEFRACADGWRSIAGQSDEQIAEWVRADGIDILMDLALHSAGNRLPVFARNPAPVQGSFAGYPGTTGLETMDFRLTDRYLEPPERDQEQGERAMYLPSFWCYEAVASEIAVNALPALSRGYVTFGCFHNFAKVNAAVQRLWAAVLAEVPGARLVVLAEAGSQREELVSRMAAAGIAAQRLEFIEHGPRERYLERYHGVDLILDTFPYNGHTTSLDALWMGVPVVTLAGTTAVSRGGMSILSNLDCAEWVTHTERQYVRVAVELAGRLPQMAAWRTTLRKRMEASPLMDAPRFARGIETAYRTMWQRWCLEKKSSPQ